MKCSGEVISSTSIIRTDEVLEERTLATQKVGASWCSFFASSAALTYHITSLTSPSV